MNTHEVEILEFITGGNHYGINVAKIREILPYQTITPIPNGHDYIEGAIMPRDMAFTIINLRKCLGMPEPDEKGYFIVTNFNNLDIAFHVDDVTMIHRVSWQDIVHPEVTHTGEEEGIATGMIKIKDRLVVILDFERIVADIHLEKVLNTSEVKVDPHLVEMRGHATILIAEDSLMLSQLLTDSLEKAGYTRQNLVSNGQEAWDFILRSEEEGLLNEEVHCVITDLEMPLMDGHQLLKHIKESEETMHIPVIIFSSIVSEQMYKKGEELGADAQLTKPEAGHLIETIDKLIGL